MREIAFVDREGLIFVSGVAQTINVPEFIRAYDTDMVVGAEYATPVPKAIQAAEMTVELRDCAANNSLISYIEKAFVSKLLVTLMVLEVGGDKIARADFFSGYTNKPGRAITSDKADTGTLKIQVADAWRTINGKEVWRLPARSKSSIDVKEIYG